MSDEPMQEAGHSESDLVPGERIKRRGSDEWWVFYGLDREDETFLWAVPAHGGGVHKVLRAEFE